MTDMQKHATLLDYVATKILKLAIPKWSYYNEYFNF